MTTQNTNILFNGSVYEIEISHRENLSDAAKKDLESRVEALVLTHLAFLYNQGIVQQEFLINENGCNLGNNHVISHSQIGLDDSLQATIDANSTEKGKNTHLSVKKLHPRTYLSRTTKRSPESALFFWHIVLFGLHKKPTSFDYHVQEYKPDEKF